METERGNLYFKEDFKRFTDKELLKALSKGEYLTKEDKDRAKLISNRNRKKK